MTLERQQLKNKLEELSGLDGSGTQLVSLYIPKDVSLSDQLARIQQEHAEADNIKSKDTRKRVQGALSKIESVLKQYKETPENGLVVFAGYIPEKDDYVVERFHDLPKPVTDSIYHCDKSFRTEPIEDMIQADGDYVLVIFDKNDAVIGEVVGTSVKVVDTLSSLVPGKTQAGGFSQQRFERLREEAKENFFQEIADSVNNRYKDRRHEIDGVLIGAPEPTKTELLNGEYLHHELRNKILKRTSISTTTEAGLRQLLDKSKDAIQEKEVAEQREICERFLEGLASGDTHVAYGVEQVQTALDYGAVDTLLVSENIPQDTLHKLDASDPLEYLEQEAQNYGSDIKYISDQFEEGQRLRNVFGGLAAILRYPLNEN